MMIDWNHKALPAMQKYAKDLAHHLTEQAGILYTAWIISLENWDVQFGVRRIDRPCKSCCYSILGKCIGTLQTSCLVVGQELLDPGELAQQMIVHMERRCELLCE